MTSVAIASAHPLSELLSEPTLRQTLRAMVRRRVPASEAEDIVQATLCDALAATRSPADPAEVPRWVTAIARNKIADHFRRARREERVDVAPAQTLEEPVEERAILRKIVSDAQDSRTGWKTLGWVVREASGDHLADIAEEENLPPAVVRQRVSRWRRRMRNTFLLAAAILGVALVARDSLPRLTSRTPVTTTAAPARVSGTWRVIEADIPAHADARLRKLAAVSLATSRLVIDGDRGRFEALGISVDRGFSLEAAPADGSTLRGALTTADGGQTPFEIRFEGEGAVVTGGGARFRLGR